MVLRMNGLYSSHRERTRPVVALTRNLYFLGPGFLAGLTAELPRRLYDAPARYMRTLNLLIRRHHSFSLFSNVP